MKVNIIVALIVTSIAALIGYGFYSYSIIPDPKLIALGSFIPIAATLVFGLAIQYRTTRTTTNIRALSVVFLAAFTISNLLFVGSAFLGPSYFIINGIILLVYLLALYGIYQINE